MTDLELRKLLLTAGGVEALTKETKDSIASQLSLRRKAMLEATKANLTAQLAEIDSKLTAIEEKP